MASAHIAGSAAPKQSAVMYADRLLNRYTFGEILCRHNAFSTVYKAVVNDFAERNSVNDGPGRIAGGTTVVIKVIKTALARKEARILQKLRGVTGVVQLLNYHTFDNIHFLVTEFCDGIDLFTYIDDAFDFNFAGMDPVNCRGIFKQLCETMNHVHELGIVHRDLKPENIMVRASSIEYGMVPQVVILDWGMAFCPAQTQTRLACGSAMYAAPEVITGRKYEGSEVDVWSLGVVYYVMITGNMPFINNEMTNYKKLVEEIANCQINYTDPKLDPYDIDVLKSIFVLENRPTLATVLKHPIFA